MTGISLGLAVELVVGVLLIATIAYCFILDRRLRALRDGESALRQIVLSLERATSRAQGAISDLRASADVTSQELARDLKRARALADELALMVEAGDHIADRLGALAGSDDSRQPRPAAAGRPARAGDGEDTEGAEAGSETGLAAALRSIR